MSRQQVQGIILLTRPAWRIGARRGFCALEPHASPLLRSEHAQRLALDVPAMRERHDHVLFGHQVLSG